MLVTGLLLAFAGVAPAQATAELSISDAGVSQVTGSSVVLHATVSGFAVPASVRVLVTADSSLSSDGDVLAAVVTYPAGGNVDFPVSDLDSGTTYWVRWSVDDGVSSAVSDVTSFTTANVPLVIGVPEASSTQVRGSVQVSWRVAAARGARVDSYRVVGQSSGRSCTSSGLTCVVSGVSGVSERFAVMAHNSVGWSATSGWSDPVDPRVHVIPVRVSGVPKNVVAGSNVSVTVHASASGSVQLMDAPAGSRCGARLVSSAVRCVLHASRSGSLSALVVVTGDGASTGGSGSAALHADIDPIVVTSVRTGCKAGRGFVRIAATTSRELRSHAVVIQQRRAHAKPLRLATTKSDARAAVTVRVFPKPGHRSLRLVVGSQHSDWVKVGVAC